MWGLALEDTKDIDQQLNQLARAHRILALNGTRVTRTEPNPFDEKVVLRGLERADVPILKTMGINAHVPAQLLPKRPNPDDALIENYAATLEERLARDCRTMWALYKNMVNKPLRLCVRDDVKPLVAKLRADGITPKTIDKRIGWLRSAVNKAIRDGILTYNPFNAPVTRKEIAQASVRKRPFSEDDMAIARRSFHLMTVRADELKLLWILCATTGMRLSEANSIEREYMEGDIRYVIVGTKNEQSIRRVPLPSAVLPLLPARINGPLFSRDPKRNSSDMNRWLKRAGIHSKFSTQHSLRHRAQDRLREAECPQDVRWELLGHEKKTVAEGYGHGSSMKKLKPWIETISF